MTFSCDARKKQHCSVQLVRAAATKNDFMNNNKKIAEYFAYGPEAAEYPAASARYKREDVHDRQAGRLWFCASIQSWRHAVETPRQSAVHGTRDAKQQRSIRCFSGPVVNRSDSVRVLVWQGAICDNIGRPSASANSGAAARSNSDPR